MKKEGPQLYLKCEWCGSYFEYDGGRRGRWCSAAHKVAAWRSKNMNESSIVTGLHFCSGYMHGGTFIDGVCDQCGEKQADQ